jgi:hypothetical protein
MLEVNTNMAGTAGTGECVSRMYFTDSGVTECGIRVGVKNVSNPGNLAYPLQVYQNGTAIMSVTNSGNIGIGTTSPGSQLTMYSGTSNNAIDITGTTQVGLTGRFTAGGFLSFVITAASHPDGYSWRFQDNSALINGGLYFRVKHSSGDTYIKGNLGIGTSAPVTKLDVLGGSARTGTAPSSYGAIYATADAGSLTSYPPIAEFRHSNQTQGIAISFSSIFATGSNANQPIYLISRGASEIQIPGSGLGGSGYGNLLVDYPNSGSAGGCITIRNSASGVGAFASLIFEVDGTSSCITTSSTPTAFSQGNGMLYCQNIGPSSASKLGFIQWNGSAEVETMTILPSGRVGIGTTAPEAPLHVVTQNISFYFPGTYAYFTIGPSSGSVGGPFTATVQICAYFSGGRIVVGGEMDALSDRRKKFDIKTLESALDDIRKVRITTYKMIDDGSQEYGVIAQELSEIYPLMVKKNGVEFLPTSDCPARIIQVTDELVGITFDNFTDITVDDKVRIVLENNTKQELKVERVTTSGIYFKKWDKFDETQKIYVYGKEHRDVQTVTKNALFMANIRATQELAEKVDKLEAENKLLHARLEALEKLLMKE